MILVGILRSILQLTSRPWREIDFLRASRGLPDAMAVDGVRLMRTRATRSVIPGPVGKIANIIACSSPQFMTSSRPASRVGMGDVRSSDMDIDTLGEAGSCLYSMRGAP